MRTWLLAFLLLPLTVLAQKTDTIRLYNGDQVVAEIKELRLGLLKLSTYYMSTVYVEWDKVESVRTDKRWILETENGARYTGVLVPDDRKDHVRIVVEGDTIPIRRIDIVEMLRLRNKFIARIDGNLNVGLSYQKVNDLTQLTVDGRATYRNTHSLLTLVFSSIQSDQNDGVRSSKQDLHLQLERTLRRRWSLGVAVGPEQNIQLGTELRLFATGFLGNNFIKSNHFRMQVLGGVQGNAETSVGGNELQSTEVFIGFTANGAAYQTPKFNLTWSAYLYDNLSIADRYRFRTDLTISYEVFKDFTVGLQGYYHVDTEPLDEQGRVDDYRSGVTIGYSF